VDIAIYRDRDQTGWDEIRNFFSPPSGATTGSFNSLHRKRKFLSSKGEPITKP